jgi:hypothetical protein
MLQNHVLAGRTSHKIALHYIKTTIYHETRLNDALKILCNNTPKKTGFLFRPQKMPKSRICGLISHILNSVTEGS